MIRREKPIPTAMKIRAWLDKVVAVCNCEEVWESCAVLMQPRPRKMNIVVPTNSPKQAIISCLKPRSEVQKHVMKRDKSVKAYGKDLVRGFVFPSC